MKKSIHIQFYINEKEDSSLFYQSIENTSLNKKIGDSIIYTKAYYEELTKQQKSIFDSIDELEVNNEYVIFGINEDLKNDFYGQLISYHVTIK